VYAGFGKKNKAERALERHYCVLEVLATKTPYTL
jgi:hypothetical protein